MLPNHQPKGNGYVYSIFGLILTFFGASDCDWWEIGGESIFVEMFDFAVTQVDNFCKNELINVLFNLFDGQTQVLFFSNQNDNRICPFKCSAISL